MKHVLLFYSATGGGHFRAAQAIEQEIKRRHPDYTVFLHDCLSIRNSGKSHAPDKTFHLFSTKLIRVYNFLFTITDNPTGIAIMRRFIKSIWGKSIARTITEFKPDIIVTTHGSASPTSIDLPNLPCPIITVVTDLNKPHELWFDNNVSAIFAPDSLTASLIQKYHPSMKPKLLITGYPLKHEFQKPTKKHARTDTLLLLGGGVGSGKLVHQARVLAKALPKKKLIAICGKNKDIFDTLTKANYPNVEHFGFVDNMKEMFDRSDIVITKAGPGTILEAAVLHKPLILTGWVTLQERDNIPYAVSKKLGLHCPEAKNLPATVEKIYEQYSSFAQDDPDIQNGTKEIVDYITEYLK